MSKTHSPQDCIYGPLNIPAYCWQIIDTQEFQRLRFITQLGSVIYVFPSANHTRFEHSLGACHLASVFMDHIQASQPELEIKEEYIQAVIIAALCHSLGHGPFSQDFQFYASTVDPSWNPERTSGQILENIVERYNIKMPKQVIEAAIKYISGDIYDEYPPWLSQIVRNTKIGLDVIKFDYLSRDSYRTLSNAHFKYDRLIKNCRIIDNQVVWKLSEIHTIEDYFYTLNEMHSRVYKHRIVQAISCMIIDIFKNLPEHFNLESSIYDAEIFAHFDDTVLFRIGLDIHDNTALESQTLLNRITIRDIYKWVGDIRIRPDSYTSTQYSQQDPQRLAEDIARCSTNNLDPQKLRVVSMKFRYGTDSTSDNPLLSVPFWQKENEIIKLTKSDLSCLLPSQFAETNMRVFVTDKDLLEEAKRCFQVWKNNVATEQVSIDHT